MGQNIKKTIHTNFADGAKNIRMKNVTKSTESVKYSNSYKSIAKTVKKSNIEEVLEDITFIFYLLIF